MEKQAFKGLAKAFKPYAASTVAGAGIGASAGYGLEPNKKDKWKTALKGAVLGGAAGASTKYILRSKQKVRENARNE